MKTIGLVTVSWIDAKILLKFIPVYKQLRIDKFRVFYFKMNEYEIFLLVSGHKHSDITVSTNLLIQKINPEILISYGVATAYNHQLEIGDVVFANAITTDQDGVFEHYKVINPIREDIQRFMFELVFGSKRIFKGTVISLHQPEIITEFDKIRFNFPVFDTDSYTITQIAELHKITHLVLKSVVHNINQNSNLTKFTQLAIFWHTSKKKAIALWLRNPFILSKSDSYFENRIRSSYKVADSLLSLLNVLSVKSFNPNNFFDYQI